MKRILGILCLSLVLVAANQINSSAADPRDVTVTVQVSDNLSGAYMIQIAEDKLNSPAAIPYASSVVVRTAASILYVRVQDRALNWSEWVTSIIGNVPVIQNPGPTPNPSASPTASPSPSPTASASPTTPPPAAGAAGGGGGGGGAPKQTALYFQVVDPADSTKVYTKSVCVEIYSRTLTPQFMGTGCSGADGRINVLVADAKVSIRVFELGNGAVYKEYTGEVASDVFTLDGGTFFPGTTRYVVSVSGAQNNTSTPTPTPVATSTPTPASTSVAIPTPTPTVVPTPSASPVASPSSTQTAVSTLSPTPSASPVAIKSSYFTTTTSSANLSKVTLKSTSAITSTKIGKSIQITVPTVGVKSVAVKVSVKDPSGKTFSVASSTLAKNKSYVTPNVKFSKSGTYVMTITLGTTKKIVTVKVSK